MKKILFLAVALLGLTFLQGMSKPATPHPITYTQPDGTTITLRLCGDEFHHYYITEDGKYVTLCDDGYFRYTTVNAQNQLEASNIQVGNATTYSIGVEQDAVATLHKELHKERRELKVQSAKARTIPMRKAVEKAKAANSEVKGLVLLVNFADKSFKTSQSTINDMMNKEGYTDTYGSIGSARDYFVAQSYGQFKPSFDVIGPVTLSRNMSYYGKNDANDQDMYPDVMVSEACEIASEQGLVDMSDYDLDGDGWVDLIYVIYAGYAESSGAAANTVWPHAWYIYQGAGRTVKVDGVYLDAYACSSELNGISGSEVDGIGTFCHEYSHTLGLPDFYDIDYSGGMGMDYWSVMDSGCYGEDGYVPINYNAFERASCGWLVLNELNEAASIKMPELSSDKNAAYRVSSSNDNRYITLETRKREGWDKSLEAEGMMVVAIDYDASVWDDNAPNDDPSHQRVKLIPADNDWDTYTLYGDLYPYGGNNKLTSSSSPAMKVYNTTISDKPITNIAYSNGVTTFDFMGGKVSTIDAPIATSAGNISLTGFTAYWSPVEGATSYTLYVERCETVADPEPEPIAFEEDFSKFTANSNTDITANLDSYTTVAGWSGSKVFCNNGEAKLGSSSSAGSLITPEFNTTTNCVIYFDARSYNSSAESGTLTVQVKNSKGTGSCDIAMSDLPYGQTTTVGIKYQYGDAGTSISFDCTKRLYLDNVRIENTTDGSSAPRANIVAEAKPNGNMQKAQVVTESCTIEGITDTYYNVTKVVNPVSIGTYRYKVMAVKDNEESSWSNIIELVIDINTSIEHNEINATNIYSTNGIIYVANAQGTPVTIYNMQGAVVAHLNTSEDVVTYSPNARGMYIVRCGNKATKVLVK